MIRISRILEGIFLVVATWYVIDAATKLLTEPHDLTFIAGLCMMALILWVWVELIFRRVKSFVSKHFKEKNEENTR